MGAWGFCLRAGTGIKWSHLIRKTWSGPPRDLRAATLNPQCLSRCSQLRPPPPKTPSLGFWKVVEEALELVGGTPTGAVRDVSVGQGLRRLVGAVLGGRGVGLGGKVWATSGACQ